ncbi:MAG: winged helix-turn-helix transcriptional regulator [Oscillospiraceae bacterium]|nr:winged helix-turn-helix transcriptional regulator [Oscillospiraceae bacterium]
MKIAEKERLFKALGDANRLIIMDLLKDNELSAGQILEEIKMGQSTLSHHMKILCDSGIVNFRKESRWVFYSINKETASAVADILNNWAE